MTTRSGWVLVGGMLALAAAVGLGRFAFTPLLPVMQQDYGFGALGSSGLAASNNVGYLLGALWAGALRTDAGRHRLLNRGLGLLVVTLALMPVVPSPVIWNGLRLVGGIASAWVFVLASALVLPLLGSSGHARWSGLHFGGVGLGIILAGTVVGEVGTRLGSDAGWLASAVLAAGLALVAGPLLAGVHARAPAPPMAPPATPAPPLSFPLSFLAAAYFCEGLGYIVTGTFLVEIVRATPGLAGFANLSWVLVGVAALPSALVWSFLAERRGYVTVLVAGHLIQATGMILPVLSGHWALVLAGAVLFGGTFLGIVGMTLAFGRLVNPGHAARVMGILTAAFGIGQILGPVLAAGLAGWGGWSLALGMASMVVGLGAGLLLAGHGLAHRRNVEARRNPRGKPDAPRAFF
ncbi:YbfB/YjiJ family MFS transporter [Pararhodospirillum oryzae]|uniref:MFS transporter n=1 Tax=Pararhodospirillum oryzae TaxID=478448 RepID=A0A512H6W6_9PROT|nr:YbfB/YjiJ family MFS transporter [Pararhodospirillum oryzae]GEO81168.1 MFS transporter [Pararhodospirillum oryzae]